VTVPFQARGQALRGRRPPPATSATDDDVSATTEQQPENIMPTPAEADPDHDLESHTRREGAVPIGDRGCVARGGTSFEARHDVGDEQKETPIGSVYEACRLAERAAGSLVSRRDDVESAGNRDHDPTV